MAKSARLVAAEEAVLMVALDTNNPETRSINLWARWVRACGEYRAAKLENDGALPDETPTVPDLPKV